MKPTYQDNLNRSAPVKERQYDSARSGFTLLELIISMALMSLVLAASWSLLDFYVGSFEKGEAGIEKARIIRSISQLLTDDLQAAIQDPGNPHIRPQRGAAQVRRFGLAGTATTLRIDVLQINPFDSTSLQADVDSQQSGLDPFSSGLTGTGDRSTLRQAPELKTVFYTFVDPLRSQDYMAEDRPGLTRRELDFETPTETSSSDPFAFSLDNSADPFGTKNNSGAFGEPSRQELAMMPIPQMLSASPEAAEVWMPEVCGLRFRYFNGTNWASSWDSIKRKGLPVAIEATLQIRPLQAMEELREASLSGSSTSGTRAIAPSSWRDNPAMERHVVIHLPGSPLQQPERERPPRPTTPRPVTPPRPVTTPTTPRPTTPSRPSEGWLRTGS
jgi:prepilin-type N-terminal cleavage/methylation domain-containing protein